jgi:hypothetical protein
MTETKAEEIISILYAMFGFMIMQYGYEKTGYVFMGYAAINMVFALWLAIKAERIKRGFRF